MIRHIKKDNRGITLLELVVATSLFTVTILMATQIFKMVIDGQRDAIASQNMQESMRYSFERIGKEMRMAKKSVVGDNCAELADNDIYYINPADELIFLDHHNDCIRYFLDQDRLKRQRNSEDPLFITISKIKINNLDFFVFGNDLETDQLLLTMRIDAEIKTRGQFKHPMQIQTSISSRHYE